MSEPRSRPWARGCAMPRSWSRLLWDIASPMAVRNMTGRSSSMMRFWPISNAMSRWHRSISPTISRLCVQFAPACPVSPRSPASTPRSTAGTARSSSITPFRSGSMRRACAAMGSTASPTNSSRAACPMWRRRSQPDGSSSPISAAALRCARSRAGAASKPRWALQHWTACRWAHGPVRPIPAWCSTSSRKSE